MPTIYYHILFWLYWAIALIFGLTMFSILWREKDRSSQMIAAMLLVPVVLRLLLIK